MTAPALILDWTALPGDGATPPAALHPTAVLLGPSRARIPLWRQADGSAVQVAALVPDLAAYVRDASDRGLPGAALLRLRRSDASALARVVLTCLGAARGIVARDLAALLRVLLELELGSLRRLRPGRVVLAAGLTDLALAARNARLLGDYARFVRRRHRAEAWLETRNPGHLLRALREWRAPVDGVLLPLNARGLGMKPDARACLDELSRAAVAVWARDVTAGGTVPPREGVAFAAARGVVGVVLRPEELEGLA